MNFKILSKLLGTSLIALLAVSSQSQAALPHLNKKLILQTTKKTPLKNRLTRRSAMKPNLHTKSTLPSKRLLSQAASAKSVSVKAVNSKKQAHLVSLKSKNLSHSPLKNLPKSSLVKRAHLTLAKNKIQRNAQSIDLNVNHKLSVRQTRHLSARQKQLTNAHAEIKKNQPYQINKQESLSIPNAQAKVLPSLNSAISHPTKSQTPQAVHSTQTVVNQVSTPFSNPVIQSPNLVQPVPVTANRSVPASLNSIDQAFTARQTAELQSKKNQMIQAVAQAQQALDDAKRRLETARTLSNQRPALETQKNRLETELATAQTQLQVENLELTRLQTQIDQRIGNRPNLETLQQDVTVKERALQDSKTAFETYITDNHIPVEMTPEIFDEYNRLITIILSKVKDLNDLETQWDNPARLHYLNGLNIDNVINYFDLKDKASKALSNHQESVNALNNPARPLYHAQLNDNNVSSYVNYKKVESRHQNITNQLNQLFERFNIDTDQKKQILFAYHGLKAECERLYQESQTAFHACRNVISIIGDEGYIRDEVNGDQFNRYNDLMKASFLYEEQRDQARNNETLEQIRLLSGNIFREEIPADALQAFNNSMRNSSHASYIFDKKDREFKEHHDVNQYSGDLVGESLMLARQEEDILAELEQANTNYERYKNSDLVGISDDALIEYDRLRWIVSDKEQELNQINDRFNQFKTTVNDRGVTEEMILANEPLVNTAKNKVKEVEDLFNNLSDTSRPLSIRNFPCDLDSIKDFKALYDNNYQPLRQDKDNKEQALQTARRTLETTRNQAPMQDRAQLENNKTQVQNRRDIAQRKQQEIFNNLTQVKAQLTAIPVLDPNLEIAVQNANQKHGVAVQAVAAVDQEIQAAAIRGIRHTAPRPYEER